MTKSTGAGRRRALAALIAAAMLLAVVPGTAQAAVWAGGTGALDQSNWTWPALAQTIVVADGSLDSVSLTLHRASTDTGTYRVEVRALTGAAPTGHQVAGTGVVLASQTMAASDLSTVAATPTTVSVNFTHPAIIASTRTVAVVLIRGANTGIRWHASTPGGADVYADGAGWFCVIGDCWNGSSPSGPLDFMLSVGGSTALPLAAPRASVTAPSSPTRAASFAYRVGFDKAVTGLTAADFKKSGTATGCTLSAPSSADGGMTWSLPVSGCSTGTLGLALRAGSVSSADPATGPATETPAAATLRIDRTKPLNGAPRAGFATGALVTSKLPVRVTWATGTDRGGAGVAKYEVSRSTNGGRTWSSLGTTQKVGIEIPTAASGTVQFRLRAIDWAGNRGSWIKGPSLTPRLAQQSSTSVRFGGSWTTLVAPGYSGGSARQSDAKGASARYTFTGRAVAIVMSAAPDLGSVKVYVDGVLKKTVDTSSFATGDKVVIYQQRFSTRATRTIRIVSSDGTSPNVIIDAFARL